MDKCDNKSIHIIDMPCIFQVICRFNYFTIGTRAEKSESQICWKKRCEKAAGLDIQLDFWQNSLLEMS